MTALSATRGDHLRRTFQSAFAALAEHGKAHPGEHAEIMAAVAAHVRSAAPLALLDLPAVAVDESPVASVTRELGEGGRYALSTEGGCVVLSLVDPHDGAAVVALTGLQVTWLRADLASVAAGVGGGK